MSRRKFLGAGLATGVAAIVGNSVRQGAAEEVKSDPFVLFDGENINTDTKALLEKRGFQFRETEKRFGVIDPTQKQIVWIMKGGKETMSVRISPSMTFLRLEKEGEDPSDSEYPHIPKPKER